jgi:hypothetical protein
MKRLNIYLPEHILSRVRIAAMNDRMKLSSWCLQAIKERLSREGWPVQDGSICEDMDKLRKKIGPIKVRTCELIKEGRRR